VFKKILLPTDGSRHSAEAARIAAELSASHHGVVHPLVAVEYQYVTDDDLPVEIGNAIRERIQKRAQKALDQADEIIRSADGRAEPGTVTEGPSADVILRAAEEGEYDVIVMGSRGVSLDNGHQRLVGSVTERVLHATPCPVLVIRAEPRP
jgi:nucleotide-binding universal stress UspA family protein